MGCSEKSRSTRFRELVVPSAMWCVSVGVIVGRVVAVHAHVTLMCFWYSMGYLLYFSATTSGYKHLEDWLVHGCWTLCFWRPIAYVQGLMRL